MNAPLYNTEILRLAASLGDQARLADPQTTVEKRSPTCGSRVTVDVAMDQGRVVAFGQDVRACALGQASAALLGQHVVGQNAETISEAAQALRSFLCGAREDPGSWPGLNIFAPARPHSARHASILLAFEAAAEAAAQKAEAS